MPILGRTPPTGYAAAADLIDQVPAALAAERAAQGWTVEQQAARIGISAESVQSLGPRSRTSTTAACLRHLGG